MQPIHADKRSQKRRNTIYYLEVYDLDSGQLLGRLADITVQGMLLLSESPIVPEHTYKCRMVLPAEILGRGNILFDATCMWSRKALNEDFFEAGFRSLIADPGDIDAIEMLIQRFAFNDL